MTNATTVTPEELLASEPKFHQGLKTPFHKEGDRTITYTWTVGDGPEWRETQGENPTVTYLAVLNITHKKGRGAAYTATLWQEHISGGGSRGTSINGRNGLRIYTDFNRAGRFSLSKLQAFAPYALAQLREKSNDPDVLAYFKPERV
jgi:hypothetical protein